MLINLYFSNAECDTLLEKTILNLSLFKYLSEMFICPAFILYNIINCTIHITSHLLKSM